MCRYQNICYLNLSFTVYIPGWQISMSTAFRFLGITVHAYKEHRYLPWQIEKAPLKVTKILDGWQYPELGLPTWCWWCVVVLVAQLLFTFTNYRGKPSSFCALLKMQCPFLASSDHKETPCNFSRYLCIHLFTNGNSVVRTEPKRTKESEDTNQKNSREMLHITL